MRYARGVKRTTIMLSDEVDARLRLEARRRGVSIADIVREAIEVHLPVIGPAGNLSFFAIGEGGSKDGSERVDEIVAEAIARHRTAPSS
jgi:ribbon-helix-helix CopG family protein